MTTALITGGTGFLGSHIVRVLLDAGHTVRVLRRSSSPLGLLDGLSIEHAIGDVTDPASLDRAMQGCEWVFHVAAVADYWRAARIKMYIVNVNGTANVLDAARKTGVRRVILTSSGAAIGFPPGGGPTNETIPFNLPPQRFPYGHSKYLAELEADRAVAQGQDVVMLNPSTIFGPGDLNQISGAAVVEVARGSVIVYPSGGMTVVDVRDVAAAHLAAAERGRSGERYLIGAEDFTHRDLLNLTADIAGMAHPFIPIPTVATPALAEIVSWLRRAGLTLPIDADQIRLSSRDIYFDCRKAWRELGKPKISARQSLEDTYDWYATHGFIKPKR